MMTNSRSHRQWTLRVLTTNFLPAFGLGVLAIQSSTRTLSLPSETVLVTTLGKVTEITVSVKCLSITIDDPSSQSRID
jgi:hypothetical protein